MQTSYFFKVLLIQNVIISIYLLCVDGVLLIISDHEDKTIWKILVMENWLPDVGFKHRVLFHNSFWRKAE